MTHIWVRAEQRDNEQRTGLTPQGAAALMKAGMRVTVENNSVRAIPIAGYAAAGCEIAPENSWPDAPRDAIIFGLKELPEDGTPLPHRHIMFGHAYKGQPSRHVLLARFTAGGGTLYDLAYRIHETRRRRPAFRYWRVYSAAAAPSERRTAPPPAIDARGRTWPGCRGVSGWGAGGCVRR